MLKKIENVATLIEKGLSLLLLLGMVVVVFLQVLTRYVLHAPLPWTEELSRYFLIWLSFIGAAMAIRSKGHFAVEYLIHKLPQKFHPVAELVLIGIMGALLGVLIMTSVTVLRVTNMQMSPALQVPMSYVYAAIPVGSLLMLVHVVGMFVEKIYEVVGISSEHPNIGSPGHH